MTDSGEIDERVTALFALLKKKNIAKAKECAEEIADAASDEEAWFEPPQIVEMLNTWLDAAIAKVDEDVLNNTLKCLRDAKVEEDSEHPGIAGVFKKLGPAVDAAGSEDMDLMLMVRFRDVKLTGNPSLFSPLGDLLKHKKAHQLHDMLSLVTGAKFQLLNDLPDDEVAAFNKMVLDYAKHVTTLLPTHKPGDMDVSASLSHHVECVNNLMVPVQIFCSMLVLAPSSWPKASAAVAEPRVIMALQDALALPKPKPKEQDFKGHLKSAQETCQGLLGAMPKSSAGPSVDDAKAFVKGLKDVKDHSGLNGLMGQMMNATDPKAIDVILDKTALTTLLASFKRVHKGEHDQIWLTFAKFFTWSADQRPAAVESVSDTMLEVYMPGSTVFTNPRALVDVLVEKSPATARKLWTKVDVWVKNVEKSKGTATYEGALYQVSNAVAGLPKVLEGAQLAEAAKLMVKLADMSRGSSLDESMKCSAVLGLRNILTKDKSQISDDTLTWVKALKAGDGAPRDQAALFLDAYAGRSLENVYEQVAEANARFKAACVDMDGLKKYVDENVAELKDFVGSITKKLPVPVQFSAEQRYVINRAMLLHFECQAKPKTSCCALPEGTFTTQTLEVNRWLKLGLSAAKIGKSVLTADAIGDVGGIVEQAQGMYKLYKKQDDADFLTFISEPFLTSEEQDRLIIQLRKSGFFKNFCYDAQSASWLCANCHAIYTKSGGDHTEVAVARATEELEGSLPLEIGGMPRQGEDLLGQGMLAKGVAVETHGTTAVCCSFFGICQSQTPEQ